MDKIHACKHPFFFPRNNFITVVKKIHFSLFKLSYKMSVNPQTPNERTDKIFDFSDFPFSRGKRKRGRWDCFPFRGKLAKNVTPPCVIRKWVIPRSFCLSARQKRHSVVVAFAGEREREREQSTPVQSFKPRTNGRTETEIHDTEPIYHRDNFELLNSPPFPPFQHHRTNWRDWECELLIWLIEPFLLSRFGHRSKD